MSEGPLYTRILTHGKAGRTFNFNNELIASDWGRGIMQITSNEYVGAGSGRLSQGDQDALECRRGSEGEDIQETKRSCYRYYSNTRPGVEANIADGLGALRVKYDIVLRGNISVEEGFSLEEMRNISAVYRYNQGSPFKVQALYEVWSGKDEVGIWEEWLSELRQFRDQAVALEWIRKVRGLCRIEPTFSDCLTAAEEEGETTSAFYLRNVGQKLQDSPFGDQYEDVALGDKMIAANSGMAILFLRSPGELRVSDSGGRVTGVIDGRVVEDIPNSFYDPDKMAFVLLFSDVNNKYSVIGTSQGRYGLTIQYIENNTFASFNANAIPITSSESHQYVVDWEGLRRGEKAVTLEIDNNGDGVTDRIVTSGNDMTDIESPVITASVSPPPNSAGWHNVDVTIVFACEDMGSGVATCPNSVAVTTEGAGQVVTGTAVDVDENSTSTSVTVNLDKTVPVLTMPSPITALATSAVGAAVDYSVLVGDNLDPNPIVSCTPASGSTFPIGTTTVTCTATDAAGNGSTGTTTVTVQVGQPKLTASVATKGIQSPGVLYVDLRFTNTGTGHGRNLRLNPLALRTLSGSGTVTYNTAMSPALPTTIGNLDVGGSTTVRVYLNAPATVTRFSITESGTVHNVTGTSFSYSMGQALVP